MSSKKKNETKNRKPLTSHSKRVILNSLKDINCNPLDQTQIINHFRDKSEAHAQNITHFIEGSAKKSQQKVCKIPTKDFKNADKLVKYLDKRNYRKTCQYDIPLALKTITEIEEHPNSIDINGIDMKKIYQTLTNLSMGYPTEALNSESHEFLRQIYHEMVTEITSNSNKDVISDYQSVVNYTADGSSLPNNPSENESNIVLEIGFLNKELNPLGIPMSMLRMKK